MKDLSLIFKALSDETRLRILNVLLASPACVCELEPVLRLPQPLLSRHLAYLRNAEMVSNRREGTRIVYSARQDVKAAPGLWTWLRTIFRAGKQFQRDIAKWEQQRSKPRMNAVV